MSWDVLHLPAILADGSSLWPEYFPLPRLESIRQAQGSAIFDCMFLGRPESLTGDIFDPLWFKSCQLGLENQQSCVRYWAEGEAHLVLREDLLVYQFWDLAISSKATADYTCCCTVALDPKEMNLFVLEVVRGHWSFEKTQQEIARQGETWNPLAVGIETVSYQAAAVQEAVRNTMLPIVEVKADKDKVTRARLPAARAEAGKIYVLQGPWRGQFLDELQAFPSGKHDDMVDALSGAVALAAAYVPSRLELWGVA